MSIMPSLRAEFAIESAPINQLHGSSTAEQAAMELEFFFPVENTLAVIKPSAFEDHKGNQPSLTGGQCKSRVENFFHLQFKCFVPVAL